MSYSYGTLIPDGGEVQQVARAADFFHAYPRIKLGPGSGAPLNEFSLQNTSYLTNVKFLALPYLLTAVILVLIAVFWNVWRYFRRGLSPGADDTKDSDPGKRDGTAKAYLLFSAFLHVCVLLLIGMASGANVTVHSAIRSSHLSIHKLRDTVEVQLYNPSRYLADWATRVNKVPANQHQDIQRAQHLFYISSSTLDTIQEKSGKILADLLALDEYLMSTSAGMFYGISGILLVFVAGGFMMYFTDVAPPRAHKTRMAMIVLFAVPLGLSWGLVAFSTVVGAAAGDFCYALREYHTVVAGQGATLASGSNVPHSDNNMFIAYDLQCPTHTTISGQILALKKFFNQTLDRGLFVHGIARLDKHNDFQQWSKTLRVAEIRVVNYEKCEAHMNFGAELAAYICGDHNKSAVSAMALLWLASVGLSMLFGVLVLISSLGQPPSEYATGYEMLQLYGAPKLIRAFGDIGNTLTRQATFHRIATSIDRNSMDGPGRGTLHVSKSVADAFTDCAIQVEDDYLVRISSRRKSSVSKPPPSTKPPVDDRSDKQGSNGSIKSSSGLFRFRRKQ